MIVRLSPPACRTLSVPMETGVDPRVIGESPGAMVLESSNSIEPVCIGV